MRPISYLFIISLGLLTSCQSAEDPVEATRPNILFAIADDWGWPHAGSYGDKVVKTPVFEKVAENGILFKHAYISSPSCTPSRAAIVTGQWHWRLEESANLWSTLQSKFKVYPDMLSKAGYHVGYSRKGWGPGKVEVGGRSSNPAGKKYKSFDEFIKTREGKAPFCFWFGANDPHRAYRTGSGKKSGIDTSKIQLPAFYPDTEAIRSDIADYYFEVQRFDREVGQMIEKIREMGELENTLVVITGDHGMPFPRCKSNLYDWGARVPLAAQWPAGIKGKGRTVKDFVSLIDLAPTFLEAAGVKVPEQMCGKSLLKVFSQPEQGHRKFIITGKERHVPAQEEPISGGYPSRAIRDNDFLFIWNLEPARWPAGTPNHEKAFFSQSWLGDTDNSPTKNEIVRLKNTAEGKKFYELNFGKRPEFELFDVQKDPDQVNNLAEDKKYSDIITTMKMKLIEEMKKSEDPRFTDKKILFDGYPYYGGTPRK